MEIIRIRLLALSIAFFIIFQSCGAYKNQPMTIDQAVASKTPVMIVTKKKETLKFKGITYYNNELIGVTKDQNTLKNWNYTNLTTPEDPFKKIVLQENTIMTIYPKREKSVRLLQVVGGIITIGATAYFVSQNPLEELFNFF